MFFVQRTAGADNRSQFLDAVMRYDVLWAIVHKQSHWFAFLDTNLLKPCRKCIAGLVHLGKCDWGTVPKIGRFIWRGTCVCSEVFVQGSVELNGFVHGVSYRVFT